MTTGTELINYSLPAGAYSITSHVTITNGAAGQAYAGCTTELTDGATTSQESTSVVFDPAPSFATHAAVMTIAGTLAAPGTVRLFCGDSTSQPSRWNSARMLIIKVGEATTISQ